MGEAQQPQKEKAQCRGTACRAVSIQIEDKNRLLGYVNAHIAAIYKTQRNCRGVL